MQQKKYKSNKRIPVAFFVIYTPIVISFVLLVGSCFSTRITEDPSIRELYAYKGADPVRFDRFPIQWTFNCDFPASKKESVRQAFRYWDMQTPLDLFVELNVCDSIRVDQGIVVGLRKNFYKNDSKNYDTLGVAVRTYGLDEILLGGEIVFFNPWLNSNYYYVQENSAIHEVGHILGFRHTVWFDCVMYPRITNSEGAYYSERKEACPFELEQFRRFYSKGSQQK